MRAIFRPTAALLLIATSACSSGGDAASTDSTSASSFSVSTSVSADSSGERDSTSRGPIDQPDGADLSDGTISITTKGGSMVMGIRNDSVLVAFSDSVRREVRSGLAESSKASQADSNDALGQMIEGIVKKSVSAGLSVVFDKARGFPIADLKDARYEKNMIVFEYRTKPTIAVVDLKENNVPFLAQFAPADAERFVSALQARLRVNK